MFTKTDKKNNGQYEFVADTTSDVSNLPTDVGVGSICMVVGDGSGASFYVLNNAHEWTKI